MRLRIKRRLETFIQAKGVMHETDHVNGCNYKWQPFIRDMLTRWLLENEQVPDILAQDFENQSKIHYANTHKASHQGFMRNLHKGFVITTINLNENVKYK